jgi:23S rRNA (uracil1939-C5)-methyltransferase
MVDTTEKQHIRQGDELQVELEDIAFHGASIGRHEGQVIFADYGIPGEVDEILIEKVKRSMLLARVTGVVEPSPDRVEPPCPYFGTCGGCQWQHIAYERQLELKQRVVSEQLRRIGKFDDPPVTPTVPSPNPYGYRNNARFTTNQDGELGYISRPGSGRQFMRIDKCLIMHPKINDALATMQGRAQVKHQVVIRYGENTDQLMIQQDLTEQVPELISGQTEYEEELGGVRFRVSASSFFQTNTQQAEKLAELAIERMQLSGNEVVVDAYAGVGTFAALVSPHAKRVFAIEEAPSALENARYNLRDLHNIEYYQGKVELVLPTLDVDPDVILLDPPRSGMDRRATNGVLKHRPRRLIYVSCDPATLARDLQILVEGGYRLLDVTPIDMFPQTYHIECIATLELA